MPQRSRGLLVHSLSDKCKLCCVSRRILVPQSLSLYYCIKCTVAAWSVSVKDIVSCTIWPLLSCHIRTIILYYALSFVVLLQIILGPVIFAKQNGEKRCSSRWCHNFNNKYDSSLMRVDECHCYEKASNAHGCNESFKENPSIFKPGPWFSYSMWMWERFLPTKGSNNWSNK